jgi:hypothetical protein
MQVYLRAVIEGCKEAPIAARPYIIPLGYTPQSDQTQIKFLSYIEHHLFHTLFNYDYLS